jgi:glycosyltransferase involved in cell wall biosynthesis
MSIRVAFTLFRDESWTGGVNYLRNLFSALAELPGRPVVPVVFVAPGAKPGSLDSLRPYLQDEPVVVPSWAPEYRVRRLLAFGILQHDREALRAFRAARIDVVFRNEGWDGWAMPIPVLAWIADFQHCHLRDMFDRVGLLKRDLKYSVYCRSATRVMVSSQDARRECEHFFPSARGKLSVVPFAVDVGVLPSKEETTRVLSQYDLPERFFYFPGQLWLHKNHTSVIEALRRLKSNGTPVTVVSTGNLVDGRHPDHPKNIMALVKQYGLENQVRFLGLVPYAHIGHLMRSSIAVLNPSLFEGWSTTVEEAKSLGVRLILSGLGVHREQADGLAEFFDPQDPGELADVLLRASREWPAGSDIQRELISRTEYQGRRIEFGAKFAQVVAETAGVVSRP